MAIMLFNAALMLANILICSKFFKVSKWNIQYVKGVLHYIKFDVNTLKLLHNIFKFFFMTQHVPFQDMVFRK